MPKDRDFHLGLIVVVLALAYGGLAHDLPVSLLSDHVGADGVPKLLAIMLGALGLGLMWRGFRASATPLSLPSSGLGSAPSGSAAFSHWRAAGLLAIGIAYVAIMPWLGFPVTTALLVIVAAIYAGLCLDRIVIATGIGAGLAFWLVFVKVLGIAMPLGAWAAMVGLS